ncbi:MAG: hypothetical protein HY738_22150 [Bacteroidia bacterium]|nr:hypothetical protein [Bacteroidia bacterium]
MKKVLNCAVIMAFVALMGFVSCKKEEIEKAPKIYLATEEMTVDQIISEVNEFDAWIKSTEKTSEQLPFHQAVRVWENMLNSMYAYPEKPSNGTDLKTREIEVSLVGNEKVTKEEAGMVLDIILLITKEHF